jgi:hypothetical protein
MPPLSVLTDLTLVLGPPLHNGTSFLDFQVAARAGSAASALADHEWVRHEHAAVEALTAREGPLTARTLLETMIGGVLHVDVTIADADRCWVRHADDQLYAAVRINTADVRPRAAALALQQVEAVEALNAVATSLATLDGRHWLAWSSHSEADDGGDEQTQRVVKVVADMAAAVLGEATAPPPHPVHGDEPPLDLLAELLRAIDAGAQHAQQPQLPLSAELRALRHREPLCHEWQRVAMDAFFLAAQSPERVRAQVAEADAAALAYLFVGKERTDRLKADPFVSPRFRRELAARAFMTAYALQRLAPTVFTALRTHMTAVRG